MNCKICNTETDGTAVYCSDCEAALELRQKYVDNYGHLSDSAPAREHHTFLRIYLFFVIIFKVTVILSIIAAPTNVTNQFVEDWNPWSEWSIVVDLVLSFVLVGFAIAVLRWWLWGIFGFIATAIASFVVDMIAKPGLVNSLYGWLPITNTVTIRISLVTMHVLIILPFLIALWLDRSNGWRQSTKP